MIAARKRYVKSKLWWSGEVNSPWVACNALNPWVKRCVAWWNFQSKWWDQNLQTNWIQRKAEVEKFDDFCCLCFVVYFTYCVCVWSNLLQHFRRQNLVSGIFVFEKWLGIMSVNLEINIFLMGGSTTDVLRIWGEQLYFEDPAGLLRLHSSFRHDFKSLDFFVEAFLDKIQIKLVCSTKRDAIDRKTLCLTVLRAFFSWCLTKCNDAACIYDRLVCAFQSRLPQSLPCNE